MNKFDTLLSTLLEKNTQGNYYHVIDSLHQFADNIKRGYIPLSFSGTTSERQFNGEYPYYLSVSRVPENDFRRGNGHVTIVLDATKINQRYKTTPINYAMGISRKSRNEAEDRILSKDEKLSMDYVKEVHINLTDRGNDEIDKNLYDSSTSAFYSEYVDYTFYFYTDKKSYMLLDKSKSLNYDELLEALGKEKTDLNGRSNVSHDAEELHEMNEFFMNGGLHAKTKTQKRWFKKKGYYTDEQKTQFSNIIHNAHRNKNDDQVQMELKYLLRYMRDEFQTSNFDVFIDRWLDKYWVRPKSAY